MTPGAEEIVFMMTIVVRVIIRTHLGDFSCMSTSSVVVLDGPCVSHVVTNMMSLFKMRVQV